MTVIRFPLERRISVPGRKRRKVKAQVIVLPCVRVTRIAIAKRRAAKVSD